MKNFKLLIAGIILSSATLFGQGMKIEDTIKVVTNQLFDVPKKGATIISNITKVNSITGALYDAKNKKIKDCKDPYLKPSAAEVAQRAQQQGGRGVTVQMVFTEQLNETGTYYLKISVNCVGENGAALVGEKNYMIIVDNPTLSAPVKIRERYFFSEQEAISFSMVEYTEPNNYSYKITDGVNVLAEGKGPYVVLGDILNSEANVGKTLTITGYYNGQVITYKDPESGEMKKAEYQVSIALPSIGGFSGWALVSDKPEENQSAWYISVDNAAVKQFLFGYFGNTPNGFVFITPKFNSLRVTSRPDNFLKGTSVGKRGQFPAIQIEVNPAFMDAMAVGDVQDVELDIQFTTQFGEKVVRKYRASVIK